MKNVVFISPNFPTNYWQFCRELRNNGLNVLGIGEAPYDELTGELQRLLTLKGFECKLIWVTNKTHYWLVVNMGGYWRHVDATPTTKHSIYVFMTDEQRYETLSGRNWKRSDWPACE